MASICKGEKGTLQHSYDLNPYNWKNLFTQFYFQLVRNAHLSEDINIIHNRLLTHSKGNTTLKDYLLRLVLQTRDIKQGKGERDLFYFMLKNTYAFYPKETERIFLKSCSSDIGSWKDVKYLVYYLDKDNTDTDVIHPLSKYALDILARQIESDYHAYNEDRFGDMSLAARWAPRREKGKFAFVTRRFVESIHESQRYTKNSMRQTRKLLALLNRDIKTPQIDMCRGTWRLLDFNKMTSYTLLKNKLAFQNMTKQGDVRKIENEDRIECADHYSEWLNSKDEKMNVSTVYPYEFVRDVVNKSPMSSDEIKYYNDAWTTQLNEQMSNTKDTPMGIMIPMIDVSGSMTCDNSLPLFNAIALGIRLTEMNTGAFHNTALTFESSPSWAHYNDTQTFCQKVRMTQRLGWGGTTNFHSALKMILRSFIHNRLSPLAVSNSSLVVFSDMQMDHSSRMPYSTVYEMAQKAYANAGLQSVYK